MNDFTKEELETIFGHLPIHTPEKYQNLYKKLKSMIDNYCDHQFILKGKGAQVFTQCCKCDYRLFKDE